MGKELFDNIPSKVEDLLHDVKLGKIGLPDLQRPFVWPDSKVRDLLDSMLKGYPVRDAGKGQELQGQDNQNFVQPAHEGVRGLDAGIREEHGVD